MSRTNGDLLLLGRMCHGVVTGVVPGGTVQLFKNKAETIVHAVALFNGGQVQGINVHGVWIMDWVRGLQAGGVVISGHLGSGASMHEGNSSSDLLLEAEVGGLVVPSVDSGGDGIHSLDVMHDPCQDPGFEIRDESGSVFDFVVLGTNDVQLEPVNVILELLSRVNTGGGQPVHGFLGGVNITKGHLEICLEGSEGLKGLVGKTLLAADFGPHGSRPFLHIGQSIHNLPVVIIV